jgi:hypothetical protein
MDLPSVQTENVRLNGQPLMWMAEFITDGVSNLVSANAGLKLQLKKS